MYLNLNSFINLISDFLSKKITGKCFEYAYLYLFDIEKNKKSGAEYEILCTLFLDVDEYCSDPKLIGEHDIDENELRRRCKVAFDKLKAVRVELFNQDKKIRVDLDAYIQLIDSYLYGNISSKCFKYIYIKTFTEEVGMITEEEYAILDELYIDLEVGNESELKERCKIALESLKLLK